VPVLDEFSSEELTRIALECPYRNYHLEEDACYIEIVDTKSKHDLSLGKTGLVVGTNLLNKATPIIRYSQGDLASISKSTKCKCRSNFRIATTMSGRYMDSVVSTSGDLIPSGCFMDLAYNWYLELDVPVHGLRYQIIQNNNGNVHVYLVSGPYGISPSQRQRVKMSMYQLLPKDMKVFVHVVDKPPINKGTKYRPVISLKGK
jgi:phenylacetate-CoA ligase